MLHYNVYSSYLLVEYKVANPAKYSLFLVYLTSVCLTFSHMYNNQANKSQPQLTPNYTAAVAGQSAAEHVSGSADRRAHLGAAACPQSWPAVSDSTRSGAAGALLLAPCHVFIRGQML